MRLLLPLLLSACAPVAGIALPAPLPAGHQAGVGAAVTGSAGPPEAAAVDPGDRPTPPLQLQTWGAFRLSPRWEGGPAFLLDLDRTGDPGEFAGGLWVRWHRPADDPDTLRLGVRVEAGWAWLGGTVDVGVALGEHAQVGVSPGAVATPTQQALRVPVSALIRLGTVDALVEVGGLAGRGADHPMGLVPYASFRLQLNLGGGDGDPATATVRPPHGRR